MTTVAKMVADGWTETQIGRALGMKREETRNAIKAVKGTTYARGKHDAVIEKLFAEGVIRRDIATAIGMSQGFVSKRIEARGWRSPRVLPPLDPEMLRGLVAKGYTLATIAAELGRSVSGIKHHVTAALADMDVERLRGRRGPPPADVIDDETAVKNDRQHVADCLAQGGFVRAVRHGDKTYWVRP